MATVSGEDGAPSSPLWGDTSDFEDTMPVPVESPRPDPTGSARLDTAGPPVPIAGEAPNPAAGQPGERSVPPWLFGVAVLVLVGMVAVLGFVVPGFFVTKVFNQVAVQNGVRSILVNEYRLQAVAEVVCPPDQRVLPGRDFTCAASINNAPAQIRVVIRDSEGHYIVNRPN